MAVPRANATAFNFSRIVIIAMENQNYGSVIGCGSCAPFINNQLVPVSTTFSAFHSYGQGIGGCSAGCYQAFVAGLQTVSDGWCPRASSPCRSDSTVAGQLSSAAFCEDGCPRGADHFPWIGETSTWNNCVTGSFTCTGQSTPSGLVLYGSSSSNGNSAFTSYLNSASVAQYVWFTPTDSHNMHDNSVSSGDSYLQTLLVGSGTVSNPSSNSVLGSQSFRGGGTILWLWWDEYDPSPQLIYGPGIVKNGLTSSSSYTEYNGLHTIEQNFGTSYLTSVVAGDSAMTDAFGSGSTVCSPLFGSSVSPGSSTVNVGQSQTFNAAVSGGFGSISWAWNFGDGATGIGQQASHSYALQGSYTVTAVASDSCPNGVQTLSASATVLVNPSTCTQNCNPPPGVGKCATFCGWGGIRLDEATNICPTHTACTNSTVVQSILPSGGSCGGNQCDMERVVAKMKVLGYNTMRVDFDPQCTDTIDNNYMSQYSTANAQAAVAIAKAYSMWIIFDYHASTPPTDNMVASIIPCWLSFWSPIITTIGPSYANIIWEPWNEPTLTSNTDTTDLSAWYQQWINQARSLGDSHYIVVQSLCSNNCGFPGGVDPKGYPTVTDSASKIFISLHTYFSPLYQCGSSASCWSQTSASAYAQQILNAETQGSSSTGWKILNTEMGADILCRPGTNCPSWYNPTTYQWVGGSAGGDMISAYFIQQLMNLYQQNNIGFMLWTAGSWTDTPNSSTYGALCSACGYAGSPGWGVLLTLASSGSTVVIMQNFSLIVALATAAIAIPAAVVVVAVSRRKKK